MDVVFLLKRKFRLRINRYRTSSGRDLCNKAGHDHGGIRNTCLRRKGHAFRHCDLWGDKWSG